MPQTLVIDHLGARGDGVAHDASGKPVYAAFAAPGDHVRLAAGTAVVVTPGPHRVDPSCRHFGFCGGCALQHVDDETYRQWLGDRIAMALAQHGISTRIAEAHVSPPAARRRAAMQARWHGGKLALGYSIAASNETVDIDQCPVLMPALMRLVAPLRTLLTALADRRRGGRVDIAWTATGADIAIDGVDGDDLDVRQRLSAFADAHDLARLTLVGRDAAPDPIVVRRQPMARFGDTAVAMPPGAFLQATADGEAALVESVAAAVEGAATIADLFAGLGTFAFPLATTAKVHAVEGWQPAVDAMASAGASQRGIAVEHRDLFRRPLTEKELNRFEAVVFDPPRTGAKGLSEAIAQSRVPRVVAVSCNPNTFARDAEIICGGGYDLVYARPVGQFLWSREVELVALFQR